MELEYDSINMINYTNLSSNDRNLYKYLINKLKKRNNILIYIDDKKPKKR
jgi:hypothetical protein